MHMIYIGSVYTVCEALMMVIESYITLSLLCSKQLSFPAEGF
jgi:hypothetical protein